jgi:hypothetical protein
MNDVTSTGPPAGAGGRHIPVTTCSAAAQGKQNNERWAGRQVNRVGSCAHAMNSTCDGSVQRSGLNLLHLLVRGENPALLACLRALQCSANSQLATGILRTIHLLNQAVVDSKTNE